MAVLEAFKITLTHPSTISCDQFGILCYNFETLRSILLLLLLYRIPTGWVIFSFFLQQFSSITTLLLFLCCQCLRNTYHYRPIKRFVPSYVSACMYVKMKFGLVCSCNILRFGLIFSCSYLFIIRYALRLNAGMAFLLSHRLGIF